MQARFIYGKTDGFSGFTHATYGPYAKKSGNLVNLDRKNLHKYTNGNERDANDTPKPPNDFWKG